MSYTERISGPDFGKVAFRAFLGTATFTAVVVTLYVLFNESNSLLNDPSRATLNTNKTPFTPSEKICPGCGELKIPVTTGGLCIDCYQQWDT